jgi:hypothetical protein
MLTFSSAMNLLKAIEVIIFSNVRQTRHTNPSRIVDGSSDWH